MQLTFVIVMRWKCDAEASLNVFSAAVKTHILYHHRIRWRNYAWKIYETLTIAGQSVIAPTSCFYGWRSVNFLHSFFVAGPMKPKTLIIITNRVCNDMLVAPFNDFFDFHYAGAWLKVGEERINQQFLSLVLTQLSWWWYRNMTIKRLCN